jgi:hypothetical protein
MTQIGNGMSYDGEWRDGKIDGFGTILWDKDKDFFSGRFLRGHPLVNVSNSTFFYAFQEDDETKDFASGDKILVVARSRRERWMLCKLESGLRWIPAGSLVVATEQVS